MSKEQTLVINNSLFKLGGTIGRFRYFINGALLLLCLFPVGLVGALLENEIILGAALIIASLFLLPYGISNNMKRLRQIRGTQKNEVPWALATVICTLIPYVNVAAYLCLQFLPKDFLNPEKSTIARDLAASATAITSRAIESVAAHRKPDSHASPEEQLAKLYDLKVKGALTDEEYRDAKTSLLKRVA